jgi:hypothetical protein
MADPDPSSEIQHIFKLPGARIMFPDPGSDSIKLKKVNLFLINWLSMYRYSIYLKGQSYENVCEIIALNDRLDPN